MALKRPWKIFNKKYLFVVNPLKRGSPRPKEIGRPLATRSFFRGLTKGTYHCSCFFLVDNRWRRERIGHVDSWRIGWRKGKRQYVHVLFDSSSVVTWKFENLALVGLHLKVLLHLMERYFQLQGQTF